MSRRAEEGVHHPSGPRRVAGTGPGEPGLHRRSARRPVGHRPDLRADEVGDGVRVLHRRRVLPADRRAGGSRRTCSTEMVLDALEMARRSRGARRLVGLVDTFRCRLAVHVSVRFTERLDEIGARPSIGTVADSLRQRARRDDQRALQDRVRLRARRHRLGRRRRARARHPLAGCTGSTSTGSTATATTCHPQSSKQPSTLPNRPTPPGLESNSPRGRPSCPATAGGPSRPRRSTGSAGALGMGAVFCKAGRPRGQGPGRAGQPLPRDEFPARPDLRRRSPTSTCQLGSWLRAPTSVTSHAALLARRADRRGPAGDDAASAAAARRRLAIRDHASPGTTTSGSTPATTRCPPCDWPSCRGPRRSRRRGGHLLGGEVARHRRSLAKHRTICDPRHAHERDALRRSPPRPRPTRRRRGPRPRPSTTGRSGSRDGRPHRAQADQRPRLSVPSVESTVARPPRSNGSPNAPATDNWTHEEFLAACLEREVAARQDHGGEGRIRAARFPARKTLEDFDFDHQRSLKRDVIAHLGTLDFVAEPRQRRVLRPARHRQDPPRHRPLIRACQAGHRVAFATAAEWVARLGDAHAPGPTPRRAPPTRPHPLLVIDEVGYIPFEAEAANLFFQLISSRYERATVIVTSNKPFGAGAKPSATPSSPPR